LKPISLLKAAAFAAALIPAAALAYRFYRFFYSHDINALTANPGDYVTDQTGTWTLVMLVITLTVTPLRRLTKWNELVKLRRMLGLFAFFYATLHMLTWLVFIHYVDLIEFDTKAFIQDIGERPFITIGMATFLILLALAVTSNRFSLRKLGKRWQKLHRLVYIAAIGGVVHFWLSQKADITLPRRWAVAVAVLLGFRLWWMWRSKAPAARPKPA
jgi:methionine sulfoxide reductase heme-binding subunit